LARARPSAALHRIRRGPVLSGSVRIPSAFAVRAVTRTCFRRWAAGHSSRSAPCREARMKAQGFAATARTRLACAAERLPAMRCSVLAVISRTDRTPRATPSVAWPHAPRRTGQRARLPESSRAMSPSRAISGWAADSSGRRRGGFAFRAYWPQGKSLSIVKGEALIKLPKGLGALHKDFRYQLTAVGGPAPGLHVAREIRGDAFKIAGGSSRLKVSWQVAGEVKAGSVAVERAQEKPFDEKAAQAYRRAAKDFVKRVGELKARSSRRSKR